MLVRISGGLGNQMFQYAFARKINVVTGEKIYLDVSNYQRDKKRKYELDKYNIHVIKNRKYIGLFYNMILYMQRHIFISKEIKKIYGTEVEKQVLHVQEIKNPKKYFIGFWQNKEYFEDIRPVLLRDFRYLGILTESQKRLINRIRNENSVAVHVRRGDYLDEEINKFYIVQAKEYYDRALGYITQMVGKPTVYFFSDDIEWCKKKYANMENAVYIDDGISGSGIIDFEIMRNCKHFVIANSTFSWWASWLAEYEHKIIIAPEFWFYDEVACKDLKKALLNNAILM